MLSRIKKDANFEENRDPLVHFANSLDSKFYTLQWKAPKLNKDLVIIKMENESPIMLSDFASYLEKNQTQRLTIPKNCTM